MGTQIGGVFISFEGGDAVGKSSQVIHLGKKLKNQCPDVVITREPGGSVHGEAIRDMLLSGTVQKFGHRAEALFFAVARTDHINTIIRPALCKKKIVICDRFFDSTRVYQGYAGNVDINFLYQLESRACGNIIPDITIILDLDPKIAIKRARKRCQGVKLDRFEGDSIKLQEKRRAAYLEIARQEPERCLVVDASGCEEEISEEIWRNISKRLDYFRY